MLRVFMIPLSTSISHYDQLTSINEGKSKELIDRAIYTDDLPSRAAHIVTSIFTLIGAPLSIISRICHIAFDIFRLIKDFFLNDQTGNRLVYNLNCIFLLDPLHIFTGTVSTIIQVIAALMGIISPHYAAKAWNVAILIEYETANSFIYFKDQLKITDNTNELLEINPHNASFYLGRERSIRMSHDLKLESNQTALSEQIHEKMAELLEFLAKEYPVFFNKKFPIEKMEKMVDLRRSWKMAPNNNSLTKQNLKNQIISLSVEQIEEEYNNNIKHTFLISNLTSGLSWRDYNTMYNQSMSLRTELDELLFQYLYFGCVRTPKAI